MGRRPQRDPIGAPSRQPDGHDNFGPYWIVPLADWARTLSVQIHDDAGHRYLGSDRTLDLNTTGNEVWLLPDAAPGHRS
jgi:hypothetical protein